MWMTITSVVHIVFLSLITDFKIKHFHNSKFNIGSINNVTNFDTNLDNNYNNNYYYNLAQLDVKYLSTSFWDTSPPVTSAAQHNAYLSHGHNNTINNYSHQKDNNNRNINNNGNNNRNINNRNIKANKTANISRLKSKNDESTNRKQKNKDVAVNNQLKSTEPSQPIIEGDIRLTLKQATFLLERSKRRKKRKLIEPITKLWTLPILYAFDGGHGQQEYFYIFLKKNQTPVNAEFVIICKAKEK
ncbi:hypothetical protein HELRODRAFT_180980 [Helobdella robusta]|uniref:Uncharacterized protein n=1 Tax=Helobdella robusta TaxID=6412 RepID=T1FGH5_HELRO|nr:hypothetical protein HELRODRAFT_180980 [Helobdella robusta]ESN93441.1 hypothetical protein HELRODRAFT_180980 [Helobdella robusta]